MSNEALTIQDGTNIIAKISATDSISELKKIIKQIDSIKVMLDTMKQFREKAIQYAKLEAAALLRVVDLGGLDKLTGTHRRTAKWLSEMDEASREAAIAKCEAGLTIDQVFMREVGHEENVRKKLLDVETSRETLIYNFKNKGIVDLHDYAEWTRAELGAVAPRMIPDVIDGARRRLRSAGAVGVGKDSMVYVAVNPENIDKVKEAVITRFNSVRADLESIRDIAVTAGLKFASTDFVDSVSLLPFIRESHLAYVLLALDKMGVLTDGAAVEKMVRSPDFKDDNAEGLADNGVFRSLHDKYLNGTTMEGMYRE